MNRPPIPRNSYTITVHLSAHEVGAICRFAKGLWPLVMPSALSNALRRIGAALEAQVPGGPDR